MSDDLIDMLIKVFHYGDNQLFDSVIDRLIKDVDELLTADMALDEAINQSDNSENYSIDITTLNNHSPKL